MWMVNGKMIGGAGKNDNKIIIALLHRNAHGHRNTFPIDTTMLFKRKLSIIILTVYDVCGSMHFLLAKWWHETIHENHILTHRTMIS